MDEADKFEQWLDRQLTGDLATGDLETELRMAVSTIRGMGNFPKDYAVQSLLKLIKSQNRALLERIRSGLDGLQTYRMAANDPDILVMRDDVTAVLTALDKELSNG